MAIERYVLESAAEGISRTLQIYLPSTAEPVSVLYVHDGQNLFDESAEVEVAWGIDRALDEYLADGGPPWIVVGIDHRGVDRIADDSPWEEPTAHAPARGDALARFVAEEATAFVEAKFPTTGRRAIAGSSLGGLMALYTTARFPEVFPRVAALSPTTMWANSALFDVWENVPPRERLYIDVGERERFEVEDTVLDYGIEVPRFVDHLRAHGQSPEFVLDQEGDHSEGAWRKRLRQVLPYLLGDGR